jgi:hypothetical protein
MSGASEESKKKHILEVAAGLNAELYTPAEIEQIKRKMIARFGASSKCNPEYIVEVLEDAGLRVDWSTQVDSEDLYEEEFRDLLHFATLEDAEMCLTRLDELVRKFQVEGEHAAVRRVLEVGKLGRRRAEMIARNHRVDPKKREEKQEILEWFRLWLQAPETFFDWLDLRKKSPDYQSRFGAKASAAGQ